ncbi:hypothetical protein HDU92_003430 [Lobulomyces angularis]|nr:hypothetical protein HDU92_003430 [Lobulomyces angularis]
MKPTQEVLKSEFVTLVPYIKEHVEIYNKWMQDEELRKLTDSDLLTLEDEFKMQRSWAEDENKFTFIILVKFFKQNLVKPFCDHFGGMAGDVNIFLSTSKTVGELSLMVAEKQLRGKKIGLLSLKLMLKFCIGNFQFLKKLEVKIKKSNLACLNLFLKFKFKKITESEVFDQVTMNLRFKKNENWIDEVEDEDEWKEDALLGIDRWDKNDYRLFLDEII